MKIRIEQKDNYTKVIQNLECPSGRVESMVTALNHKENVSKYDTRWNKILKKTFQELTLNYPVKVPQDIRKIKEYKN